MKKLFSGSKCAMGVHVDGCNSLNCSGGILIV